jgi:hypothetical protein
MNTIKNVTELKEAILLLETKQLNEGALLKSQIKITYEKLRFVNLIKNSINELNQTPDFKEKILNATLSLAAGYLSKKVVLGNADNQSPLKKILGTILQLAVTSTVATNTDGIKLVAKNLMNSFFNEKDTPDKSI